MKTLKYWLHNYRPYVLGSVFFLLVFLFWKLGQWLGFPSLYSLLAGVLASLPVSAMYVLFLYRRTLQHGDIRGDTGEAAANANPQVRQEIDLLRERLQQSIEHLRSIPARKGYGCADALYALPWYLVIGPPSSGKSTLLQHSGLNFPYAGREGAKVAGDVRCCDCLFSTEAVLLNMAGRYLQNREDTDTWRAFLGLLRKHRPRLPLNGLIVAVSIEDLLGADTQECELLAKRLRERIQDVHDLLELRLPIYLVLTQCDRLPGFTDFYAHLDSETRGEVMGITFAHNDFTRSDWGQRCSQALDGLQAHWQAVAERQLTQQDIRTTRRDTSAYRLPLELAALGTALRLFAEELLRANPYQSTQLLRGIYLTAAVGAAAPVKSEYVRLVSQRFSLAADTGTHTATGQGQTLFINGLLQKVIIPDQHLAGLYRSMRRESRHKAAWVLAAASMGLLLCSLWGWSYSNNRAQLRALNTELSAAMQQDALASGQYAAWHSLDTLQRWAKHYYLSHHEEGIAWRLRFGLYQGHRLEPLVRARYFSQLEAVMLKPAAENLTRTLYRLPEIKVYPQNTRELAAVTGIPSVQPSAWPADNRATSVANFGQVTLDTYRMLSRAYRDKADTAFLQSHLPDYWYPDIAAHLAIHQTAAQTAGGTAEQQYQSASRQVAFYSEQIHEADVPGILDNSFLLSSSRHYIDSLLSQSLRSIETITLESDTLFAFGRSDFQSLQADGQRQLNAIASKLLSTEDIGRILISGHADRLGDAQGNLRVSQQRAETIRTYLAGKGIPTELLEATGEGSAKPLVQCAENLPRAALIQCLEPNRRVEIEIRVRN